MPVIRSVVRSVLSDAIREAIVSPWRYFSTFDPVLNTYGELDTAFTPSGDFEVEVDVLGTITALPTSIEVDMNTDLKVVTTGSPNFNLTVVI